MLRSGTIAAVLCNHGGPDVGRRDVAVVPADSGVAAIRGGGHSEHAGISGAQMGVRAAHGVYRRVRRVSLRARLPGAAARTARALRRGALAAGAGIDDALRRRTASGFSPVRYSRALLVFPDWRR